MRFEVETCRRRMQFCQQEQLKWEEISNDSDDYASNDEDKQCSIKINGAVTTSAMGTHGSTVSMLWRWFNHISLDRKSAGMRKRVRWRVDKWATAEQRIINKYKIAKIYCVHDQCVVISLFSVCFLVVDSHQQFFSLHFRRFVSSLSHKHIRLCF